MKKFLVVIFCLLGFSVIVTLCYFFGYNTTEIFMPVGNYYLYEIKTGEDEQNMDSTLLEGKSLYLTVSKDNKIRSYSGEEGFLQDDQEYSSEISGTGLKILLNKEVKYEGFFVEKLIVIRTREIQQVEGEEKTLLTDYYYKLEN